MLGDQPDRLRIRATVDETDAVLYRLTLEEGLEELRIVDAKHRLAYTLLKVAQWELECGRIDAARTRASEALEYATALRRGTGW